jgi:hypothetical protein
VPIARRLGATDRVQELCEGEACVFDRLHLLLFAIREHPVPGVASGY